MSTIHVAGPRLIVSVMEDARRSVPVANNALAGRFSHNGVTLALGTSPDWINSGLPDDVEWRAEWAKCNEGLDLAHAFAVTGDEAYVRAWEQLVATYTAQVPVGHDRSEISARRMQNWLYAWQRFREAGAAVDADLVATMVARLRLDADHLVSHLTPERNHRTLELYALFLAGLALDERGRAVGALDAIADNAERDILPDGVHRERSSDYHMIVLRSFVGTVSNARRANLTVPANLLERTQRACDVALHLQRPDGMTPALSDGDVGDFRSLLGLAGDLFGRDDLRWASTAGASGAPPKETSAAFPIGGYAMLRSGWGDAARPYADEHWGVFDCGPLGDGGHGHYDHLAVELWGHGRPLVLDAGRHTYADGDDGWRHWFKGTAAHNTVCVDGFDQTPYRPGKPKGETSTATLAAHQRDGRARTFTATATSPCYDAVHTRSVALVGGERWVVRDHMRSRSVHDYAARWHLPPSSQGTVRVAVRGGEHVIEAADVRLTVPCELGDVGVEDGWMSPAYGVKHAAPVVVVRARRRSHDFVTTIEAAR